MTISGKSWMINGVGKAYQQFRPQINLNPAQKKNPAATHIQAATRLQKKVLQPSDILSMREKDTLRALFSIQTENHSFYGHTRVQNVQAGYLLDIKG